MAAGLPMVGENKNPETTTYGVGQLMAHAVEQGYREILLGLGAAPLTTGAAAVPPPWGYASPSCATWKAPCAALWVRPTSSASRRGRTKPGGIRSPDARGRRGRLHGLLWGRAEIGH